MTDCVVFDGPNIIQIYDDVFWAGLFSQVRTGGEMVQYIKSNLHDNVVLVIPKSDGNITRVQKEDEWFQVNWDTQIQPYLDYAKSKNKTFIIGTLCQIREEPDCNYVYLPLDDNFFANGVNTYFKKECMPKWEDRSSTLCWRGGCSGIGGNNSIRAKFVDKIYKYNPNTNVRLSTWWCENKNIPEELFDERIDYTEFLKYKIFFIVDGNCIASNHMYGFATGCVPFMISNAKCWFSHLLVPDVHYIPINYDLSNLIEKIEWVNNNDDQAKIIAENAYNFSETYFSCEYQRKHIKESIEKCCKNDG